MIRAIRSYITSLKASRLFGRAGRLRDAGRKEEALNVARQSLTVLREPWVVRLRPAEGSVLLCTTMLVEQVATELNQHGADNDDLADALAYLKSLPPGSELEIFGSEEWVPYLESRLKIKGQTNAV
ncbi:MAG: hypothetical protein ABL911_00435 [Gallionella sp.]|nr:hypothetical protein [Gallionella sp.]